MTYLFSSNILKTGHRLKLSRLSWHVAVTFEKAQFQHHADEMKHDMYPEVKKKKLFLKLNERSENQRECQRWKGHTHTHNVISTSSPPEHKQQALAVLCVCTVQQLLPSSAAGRPGDRGIVVYVNTVYPAEVKIVPCSILSQQSQRWLGQKQYLDMAADVPKQAQ